MTLSPYRRRHWLESYRGLRLRFSSPRANGGGPAAEDVRRFILARVEGQEVNVVHEPVGRKRA